MLFIVLRFSVATFIHLHQYGEYQSEKVRRRNIISLEGVLTWRGDVVLRGPSKTDRSNTGSTIMVDNSVPPRPATVNLSPQQILNKRMVNAHVFFFFSSAIRLVLMHRKTVKSRFQAYVLSSPKILYFFWRKKAVMPFQVWVRNHNR